MDTTESIMRTVVAGELDQPHVTTARWANQTAPDASTPHPAQRRVRWVLAIFLLGLLAAGVSSAAHWILTNERFNIIRVRVEGEVHHTSQTLLQGVLSKQIEKNFFALNLDEVRSALEALPWIAEGRVRRVWPLTLVVWVRERKSLAHWGSRSLVSPDGVIFTPDLQSIPTQLLHLQGPEGSANLVIKRYRWLQERLDSKKLTIARLHLSDRHAWYLECTSGLRLFLGTTDIEKRVERLLHYIPKLPQPEALDSVDLRYNNGFAVRWRDTSIDTTTSNNKQRP